MKLYGYWRSSATYRVRITLALKGLDYEQEQVDLRTGRQHSGEFRTLNPHELVPCLIDGEACLTQSLAIIEYLDERYPKPRLIPQDPVRRAEARALALAIACDIHPINNLRVQKYLQTPLGLDQQAVDAWSRHWIEQGFTGLEAVAHKRPGQFLAGESITVADVCLVPQLYNARRVQTPLDRFPALLAIEQRLLALPAFQQARPEAQPGAEPVTDAAPARATAERPGRGG
jgi:maleylacetoacetate isomerase